MIVTFLAPSSPRPPSGGVTVVFELASALAGRGHDVYVLYGDLLQVGSPEAHQMALHLRDDSAHEFAPEGSGDDLLPTADVIFGYRSDPELPPRTGLPMGLVQGYKMLGEAVERLAYHQPCPKICVAGWLVDVGRELGVPDRQLVHIPPGLRHEQYRLVTPIAERPPRVSFCYSPHQSKGAEYALAALSALKKALPDVEVVAFGAAPAAHELPVWVTYRMSPSQEELVDEIYNGSRIFLCSSRVEGFGLPCIEAMACGAALVTTDNGGSRDYAFHDRTALVSPPRDVDAMADHVATLLRDDDRRIRLATAGQQYVQRFQWDRSAEELETFIDVYRADPVAYGRPAGGHDRPARQHDR